MKLGSDIHVPLRMNCINVGDPFLDPFSAVIRSKLYLSQYFKTKFLQTAYNA